MSDRPNVLVYLTDQQRWDTAGAYGNPMDITPTLDGMAERGLQIEHMVSPHPVCTPARGCLQSGQYGMRTGVMSNDGVLRDEEHFLANQFARSGYQTAYVGKWHLSSSWTDPVPEEERCGWEYWRGVNSLEFNTQSYEGFVWDEDGNEIPFRQYRVDAMTDLAIDFLREDREAPFFLFLSQLEPHHENDLRTFIAPDGYARRYRNPYVPPDLLERPDSGNWIEELPDYYGCCARLDDSLGRLLAELEEQGILEETIVLFTSDHGCHFGTRGGGYKGTPHEASCRIPAIFRGPGFDGAGRIDEPVSLIDVPPTLLDAAGLPVPEMMQGDSIVSLVDDPDGLTWKDEVYLGLEGWHAIRTDRWKYAVAATDRSTDDDAAVHEESLLYDLDNNPWENDNLIGRPEFKSVAARLRDRLIARACAANRERIKITPAARR